MKKPKELPDEDKPEIHREPGSEKQDKPEIQRQPEQQQRQDQQRQDQGG